MSSELFPTSRQVCCMGALRMMESQEMAIKIDPKTAAEAERMIDAGEAIKAVKLVRERTGCSLEDAKEWVGGRTGDAPGGSAKKGGSPLDRVEPLLFEGKIIDAIKAYREATGCDLKRAKETVEAREKALRMSKPEKFTAPPRRAGCLGMLGMVMLGAAGVLAWAMR